MSHKPGRDKLANKKRIVLGLEHIADNRNSTIDEIRAAARFAKHNRLIGYVARMESWLAWSAFNRLG